MKHFLFTLLLLASVFATADAQTISITNTSVELIGSNSVTRSFYDLDKCYLTYNNGIVKLFDAAANTQLFSDPLPGLPSALPSLAGTGELPTPMAIRSSCRAKR